MDLSSEQKLQKIIYGPTEQAIWRGRIGLSLAHQM